MLVLATDFPDLYEASVLDLQTGLENGNFSSVDLIKVSTPSSVSFLGLRVGSDYGFVIVLQAYFARIEEVNLKGAALRAVLETNPSALAQAKALDEERRVSGPRSLLHGIPVLLKDNIATVTSEGRSGRSYASEIPSFPSEYELTQKYRNEHDCRVVCAAQLCSP